MDIQYPISNMVISPKASPPIPPPGPLQVAPAGGGVGWGRIPFGDLFVHTYKYTYIYISQNEHICIKRERCIDWY